MPTPLSFTGTLTGTRALEQLLQPMPVEDPDTEVCLNLLAVESIDVIGAAAARMRIQRHLREHPQGSVTIWPPRRAAVAARFFALLGEFSERVYFESPEAEALARRCCPRRRSWTATAHGSSGRSFSMRARTLASPGDAQRMSRTAHPDRRQGRDARETRDRADLHGCAACIASPRRSGVRASNRAVAHRTDSEREQH